MTYAIRKILVPVDFSALSLNAVETAVAMCKRQHATVTLVHVVETTYPLFPPEAGSAGAILAELMKTAVEELNELARALRSEHDVVINHVVQSGNPADEICRIALYRDVDLVIMGTHGASGWREFFMGSNAYRVVKNAPCPVLTVPGTETWTDFKRILFPIRMIPGALDKYDVVRPVIRRNGSTLILAKIVKKGDPAGFVEMKEVVDAMKKKIAEDDVRCSTQVYYCENVSSKVLDISTFEEPDLIVITATLDASVQNFFMGPYTQKIVNHARFPVLSIRPAAKYKTPNAEEPAMAERVIL